MNRFHCAHQWQLQDNGTLDFLTFSKMFLSFSLKTLSSSDWERAEWDHKQETTNMSPPEVQYVYFVFDISDEINEMFICDMLNHSVTVAQV